MMTKIEDWKSFSYDNNEWTKDDMFPLNYYHVRSDNQVIKIPRDDVEIILRNHFNAIVLADEIPEIHDKLIDLQLLIKLYTIDEKYLQRD